MGGVSTPVLWRIRKKARTPPIAPGRGALRDGDIALRRARGGAQQRHCTEGLFGQTTQGLIGSELNQRQVTSPQLRTLRASTVGEARIGTMNVANSRLTT